jgi:hypothetical protein
LTLLRCLIDDNIAAGGLVAGTHNAGAGVGGGVYAEKVTVAITDTAVTGNTAAGGGALSNNPHGDGRGGGVALVGGSLTVTGGTLGENLGGNLPVGNTALGAHAQGGGEYASGATVSLAGTAVQGNSATGGTVGGGGAYADGGSLTLAGTTVSKNAATGSTANGGGVFTTDAALTLQASAGVATAVTANVVLGYGSAGGGGLYVDGGTGTLTGGSVSDNSVTASDPSSGGGVFAHEAALTVTDLTVSGNAASGGVSKGGGWYQDGGTAALTRLTITGNSATATGMDAGTFMGAPSKVGHGADGGGVFGVFAYTDPTGVAAPVFTITDSEVDNNSATGATVDLTLQPAPAGIISAFGGPAAGGGLHVITTDDGTTAGHLTVGATALRCTFANNHVVGGLAYLHPPQPAGEPPVLPWAKGGAAESGGATIARLIDSTIVGNTATGGAGTNDYQAFGYGGRADGGGFGGYQFGTTWMTPGPNDGSTVYHIYNSTIAGNTATAGIGTIPDGTQTQADSHGGGVNDGQYYFDPTANNGAGAYIAFVEVYSTIVATNLVNPTLSNGVYVSGPNGDRPDIFGGRDCLDNAGLSHPGHNLIGDNGGNNGTYFPSNLDSNGVPQTNSYGDLVGPAYNSATLTYHPFDPHLLSLGIYGGLTKTCPPMFTQTVISPAIDNGEDNSIVNGGLATDQTGRAARRYHLLSSNPSPDNHSDYTDVGAVEELPVPTIAGIQVNDGSVQRSEVRSLTVTFSGPVAFAGGDANAAAAFQLMHVSYGTTVYNTVVNNLQAAVSTNGSGQTVVTLTFSTTGNAATEVDPTSVVGNATPVPGPSLGDGKFQLSIYAANVGWDALAVDGDGDGVAGGDYVSPAETAGTATGLHLWRIYGDATGDGIVDPSDFSYFGLTYNAAVGNPNYIVYMDADNSGVVDLVDLNEFRNHYNHTV